MSTDVHRVLRASEREAQGRELPRVLKLWSGALSLMAPELHAVFTPWLPRLDIAIGAVRATRASHREEPDGYAGLSRRGPYERLLASEWLLADEMPEEFYRRAAMKEHLFYDLARRGSKGSQRVVVLFDAGPWQLGAPRLVHLALLILLERRAQEANAQFLWGILQRPEEGLFPGFDRAAAQRLLQARCGLVPGQSHVEDWRVHLEACDIALDSSDEFWWVSAPRCTTMAQEQGANLLALTESLPWDEPSLTVQIHRASCDYRSAHHAISLPLPSSAVCGRLLRDPFCAPTRPFRRQFTQNCARLLSSSNLLFSPNGKRLFARLEDGTVIAFSVPNSPRATPGKARVFRPPNATRVISVGWVPNRFLCVLEEKEELFLWGAEVFAGATPWSSLGQWSAYQFLPYRLSGPGKGSVVRKKRAPQSFVYDDALRLCTLTRVGSAQRRSLLTCDADRKLFQFDYRALGAATFAHILDRNVLGFTPVGSSSQCLSYVAHSRAERQAETKAIGPWEGARSIYTQPTQAVPLESHHVCFGHSWFRPEDRPCLIALCLEATVRHERWIIRQQQAGSQQKSGGRKAEFVVEGARVVGAMLESNHIDAALGLIVLEDDGCTLALLTEQGRSPILVSNDLVQNITVSAVSSAVAWSTERGEVVVYSLEYRRELLRFRPGYEGV